MLDGEYKALASYDGKRTALFFWAQWCSFSRSRIVKFNELAKFYKPKDINFIAVSADDYEKFNDLTDFIRAKELVNVEHAFSGNGIYDEAFMAFGVSEYPSFVVMDENLNVILYTTDIGEVEDLLR